MGKALDLTGKKFGKLTVLSRSAKTNKWGAIFWLCQCDCGKQKVAAGKTLKNGKTKNCGCERKTNFIDRTGKKYGRLTALKVFKKVKTKNATIVHWLCECSCGKYHIVLGGSLANGSTKSCGCLRIPKLTGQKFGRLTVLRQTRPNDKYGKARWLCECECGKRVIVAGNNLQQGTTSSCGCLKAGDDLTGQKFGRWKVLSFAGRAKAGGYIWNTVCSCGTVSVVSAAGLKNGSSQSCGCLQRERFKESIITHGQSSTITYKSWSGMIQRMTNPSNKRYPQYGGKGLRLAKKWRAFEGFFEDMGERPDKSYTLDRINPKLGYFKSNCRWASLKTQYYNKLCTRKVEWKGQTLTVRAWADKMSIPYETLMTRLDRNWEVERALTQPVQKRKAVAQFGHFTYRDLSDISGLPVQLIKSRLLHQGYELSMALEYEPYEGTSLYEPN